MASVQLQTSTDLKKDNQDLIRGEFSPSDAQEIVNHMISKKISFHELRNFSSEIRFGQSDDFSQKRCEELKESQISLSEVIQKAEEQGKKIRLESKISIVII